MAIPQYLSLNIFTYNHTKAMTFSRNLVLTFILLFVLFVNLLFALPHKNELLVILHNPFLSQEDRFRLKVGSPAFEYLRFLKENTPSDAVISLPPDQPEYRLYGNYLYMNYFLYPRKLIPSYDSNSTPSASATHALVIMGVNRQTNQDCCLWPVDTDTKNTNYLQTTPILGVVKLK
jgi:hypothetical protein